MKTRAHWFTVLLAFPLWITPISWAAAPSSNPAEEVAYFEKHVRPLLVNNCYNCHSANTKAAGGLRVDDRNGLLQGGNSGAAIVPGSPEESYLLQAVRHEEDAPKMPPKKKLTDEDLAILTRWIERGAAWPQAETASVSRNKSHEKYETLRNEHWSWQPLREAKAPAVNDAAWPHGDIDRFVLATLEEQGLNPVRDADRTTLIRRVTFDLTGLPPTPAETTAFLDDDSANAFETVVDRLLATPQFGERWGRHWLDVARYGESTGASRNVPYPHAWRYRDYVIDAFNQDKPFNTFIREQVAGDLLPAEGEQQRWEQNVATGFLALGVKDVNQRFKVRFVMDNVDEQIDAVSRGVLGLTASCARCHDHKFDPIPQADYYALAGIFTSTDLCAGVRNKMGGGGLDYYDTAMILPQKENPEIDAKLKAEIEEGKKGVAAARSEFQRLRDSLEGSEIGPNGRPKRAMARQKLNRLERELLALTDPASHGPVALGVREAKKVADTEIRIRGEAEKLGPAVPRGFLSVVAFDGAPKIDPAQSGRRELADWLTHPNNPLTPRVLANRVWQHLFGQGIVRTVDNLGITGDKPSHPELLDYLASDFIKDNWSVKRLIRKVVLSRAYQLSSDTTQAHLNADPSNRFVWRHATRRLEAEEIRDAMLAASGVLDPARPDASPAKELPVIEIRNNGPEANKLQEAARASLHRSVYLPLVRGVTPLSLAVFDFAEQGMVTGQRDTTTVSTQALYFLNDPFVRRQSLVLAERLLNRSDLADHEKIELVYRRTLGRAPSSHEIARATVYLASFEDDASEGWVAQAAPTPAPAAKAEAPAKKPEAPANPDDVDQTDLTMAEESVQPPTPRAAAWASLCQALFGSAEFRYVR